MKMIKIGLAAALAVALLTPAAALAQGKAPKINEANHKKGVAEAPALVAGAKSSCVVADALYIGGAKDAKAKTSTDAYELACTGNLGQVIMKVSGPEGDKYQAYSCLATATPTADGKPNTLKCTLPANLDPAASLAPYVTKAGLACTIGKARVLGETKDTVFFEIACDGNRGYILGASNSYDPTKDVSASNCLGYEEGGAISCTLTPRAAQLAAADALAVKADASCAIKDRRYALSSKTGDDYYEVSCNDGKGFFVVADVKGAFKEKVECANADYIAGGCTLTDVKTAKTDDNDLYTKLAKAGGYDCIVSGYRALTAAAGSETVELQCSNRPDGAVAIFAAAGGKSKFYNCAAADLTGYRCGLTKVPAAYALLTAAVKKSRPTSTCVVSDAKFLGASADAGYVEVACADKEPGYVVRYPKATDVSDAALYCTQAKTDIGTSCTLPTNVKK